MYALKEIVTDICKPHGVDVDEFMLWAFGPGYKEAPDVTVFCRSNWKHPDRFEIIGTSRVMDDIEKMVSLFREG